MSLIYTKLKSQIMRKFTFFLLAVFVSSLGVFSQNLLEGWNNNSGTPKEAGWEGPVGNSINWTSQIYWRTNVGSPVSNGTNPMLYTNLRDTKINYKIGTLPQGKFYQLTGKVWRRNGGTGATAFDFEVATNIDATNPLLQYTYTANGNNVVGNFTTKFAVPSTVTVPVYLLWDAHLNSGSWQDVGVWDLALTELGNALTVTFNTNGGSQVVPQYILAESGDKATKPATDPTRDGYLFKGWYDATLTTNYDFSASVSSDITIHAKWEDIKEGLNALIVTATNLKAGGTTKGQTFLQNAIDAAQLVVNNGSASTTDVANALNALTAAIADYQNVTLSSISLDGVAIAGFSPSVYSYNYSLAPSATVVPVVTATANASAELAIYPTVRLPGVSTVTITAGNGSTKDYTVNFIFNYIVGWDGNNTDKTTPGAAGWLSPDDITWSALNTSAGRNCYRDGLASGGSVRALVGNPYNKYAYPLSNLTEGKVYTFSCAYKWVSNGNAGDERKWTFGANSAIDGNEESMLNQVSGTSGGVATATFSFAYSGGDVYLVWNGNYAAYAIDNLLLVEDGNALKVEFNTNGGSAIEKQYLLSGSKISEPADPTKGTSTFAGWYTEASLTNEWNFENTLSTDLTLYAKWDNGTSIELASTDNGLEIVTVDGGVKIVADKIAQINVVSLLGKSIISLNVSAGETFIQLTAGVYIVNGTKVLVK